MHSSLTMHDMQADLNDTPYKEIKEKLFKAIQDENHDKAYDEVVSALAAFTHYVKGKFISSFDDDMQVKNYRKQLPTYIDDLIHKPDGNSLIQEALKKQNLNILHKLLIEDSIGKKAVFKEADFFDYLNQHLKINPNTDQEYLNFKKQLIQVINSDNPKVSQEILGFYKKIQQKFFILSKDPDLWFVRYFNGTIWPQYLENLYPDLITAAIDKNNIAITYALLKWLISENKPTLFSKFLPHKLSSVQALLGIKNQPIYDALDYLIILGIQSLMSNYDALVEFLNDLKKKGIDSNRLDNNILKTFASLHILAESDWIKEIQKNGFLINFNEQSYQQLLILFNIISHLKNRLIDDAILLANTFDQKFIDQKDTLGDSLLINASKHDLIESDEIKLIKILIANKMANINQAGQAGLTPLMHTIKTRYISAQDQINMIEYLIQKGANPEAKDVFGKTALDYAKEANNAEAIKLLEQHMRQTPAILSIKEQIIALNNLNSTLGSLASKR